MYKAICIIFVSILILGCNNPLAFLLDSRSLSDPIVRLVPPPGRDPNNPSICTGEPFEALMTNMNEWTETQQRIDLLGYYCWILYDNFRNSELQQWFCQLNEINIPLSLEVCVIKPMSGYHTGEECFAIEAPRWTRFLSLSANIAELTLDEPLTGTRAGGLGGIPYAVTETADWIELTRQFFNDYGIGVSLSLIEAYPHNSMAEILKYVQLLQQECANRNVEGINSLTIDYNWHYYPGRWQELYTIQLRAERLGLAFALIYWPSAHSNQSTALDIDFYNDIMLEGDAYAGVDGYPGIFAIQSWDYIPYQIIPEQPDVGEYPYCYSFLVFYNEYISQ
jgi:hypothetical protein